MYYEITFFESVFSSGGTSRPLATANLLFSVSYDKSNILRAPSFASFLL